MITIHNLAEAEQLYRQGRISFRLMQDQAAVLIGTCQNEHPSVSSSVEITEADIDWLLQQPEANQDFSNLVGGHVYICEHEEDLKQIVSMDMDWATTHDNQWPNVTDLPMAWDSCDYLLEVSGGPQWIIFLTCWNDSGGPAYYVPRHLWAAARATEHMEMTKQFWRR